MHMTYYKTEPSIDPKKELACKIFKKKIVSAEIGDLNDSSLSKINDDKLL